MIKLKCLDCENEGILADTEFKLLEREFKFSIESDKILIRCSKCGKEILKEDY